MPEINVEIAGAPETCPVCGASKFAPSGQTVDLLQVLGQWEEVLKCSFPNEVTAHYAKPEHAHSALLSCEACGFELFFPTVTGTADFYERIEVDDYYNVEKWEFRLALKFIKNMHGGALLDIGCGAGTFLDQLRIIAPTIRRCGHELTPKLRPILEGHGHELLVEPLTSMEPAKFDVVTAFQVLEHAADPTEMLSAMFDLVRPGGYVFVATPNQAGPIQNFTEALTEIPPHHVSRWTPRALRLAIEHVGFTGCQTMFEPLARVLWDAYLPVVMDTDCWVSSMYGCFTDKLDSTKKASFLNHELKRTGFSDLYGVVGQSIFVAAKKPG